MAARVVRSVGIVACVLLAVAVNATPAAAAPVTVPGLLEGVRPNALTARFEKCMSTTPGTPAPAAGANGQIARRAAVRANAAAAERRELPREPRLGRPSRAAR